MSKFFRILAIILLIISAMMLLVGLFNFEESESMLLMISGFCGIVSGLAIYSVGDLLDRVDYLEDKLGIHLVVKSEDKLPQVKCKKCNTEYDMDYPKCPCCGNETKYNDN